MSQAETAARCMAEHPNKHIREAIKYAEQNGWTFVKASARAHIYGVLYCQDAPAKDIVSTSTRRLANPKPMLATFADR